MNYHWIPLLVVTSALSVSASPLPMARVGREATWVLHLDVDALQRTRVGGLLLRQWMAPMLSGLTAGLPPQLALTLDPTNFHGLTVYGNSLDANPEKNSALIIHSQLPLQGVLDTFVALGAKGAAAEGKSDGFQVKKLAGQKGAATYVLNKELFAGFLATDCLVVGPSQKILDEAMSASLNGEPARSAVAKSIGGKDQGFLVLGVSESYTQGLKLPQPFQVLNQTEGLQLHVREKEEDVVAQLSMKAKAPDVAGQIQQAVQGAVAMATLAMPQEEAIQSLVKGLKIQKADRSVDITLGYPIRELLKRIETAVPAPGAPAAPAPAPKSATK